MLIVRWKDRYHSHLCGKCKLLCYLHMVGGSESLKQRQWKYIKPTVIHLTAECILCVLVWGGSWAITAPLTALVKWDYCPRGFDTNLRKHSFSFILLLAATEDQLRLTLPWTTPAPMHTHTHKKMTQFYSWNNKRPSTSTSKSYFNLVEPNDWRKLSRPFIINVWKHLYHLLNLLAPVMCDLHTKCRVVNIFLMVCYFSRVAIVWCS